MVLGDRMRVLGAGPHLLLLLLAVVVAHHGLGAGATAGAPAALQPVLRLLLPPQLDLHLDGASCGGSRGGGGKEERGSQWHPTPALGQGLPYSPYPPRILLSRSPRCHTCLGWHGCGNVPPTVPVRRPHGPRGSGAGSVRFPQARCRPCPAGGGRSRLHSPPPPLNPLSPQRWSTHTQIRILPLLLPPPPRCPHLHSPPPSQFSASRW